MAGKPVAIIMGSQSDWATMTHAAETLDALGIGYEALIVSAHRTPERLFKFGKPRARKGFKVVIAGAGGAAHLPGMTASLTPLPVFGVPMNTNALDGKDSLLSIVQMPAGIPVGTLAIGKPGAINAALLAAAVLALSDDAAREAARRLARGADRNPSPKPPEGPEDRCSSPDSTIGILGGGQLGRMLALAAARLGFKCHVFAPSPDAPAFDVVHRVTTRGLRRHRRARPLRRRCRRRHLRVRERAGRDRDVPRRAQAGPARPDRCWRSRRTGRREGTSSATSASRTPFARVDAGDQLAAALDRARPAGGAEDAPLRLRRQGPDDHPQRRRSRRGLARDRRPARDPRSLHRVRARGFGGRRARADGEVACFDLTENEHRDHILKISRVPAQCPGQCGAEDARQIAETIADAFDYVGVLAVEMFVVADARRGSNCWSTRSRRACTIPAIGRSTAPRSRSSSSTSARSPAGRSPRRCGAAGSR